jgi:O-antigen/teichoic acid export membrane protein
VRSAFVRPAGIVRRADQIPVVRLVLRPAAFIRESPLGGRLAGNAAWMLVGALASRGLQLAAVVAAARCLGQEQFGRLGIVQSTVGLFGALAGFGIGLTATKYVAEWRAHDPARTGRIVALSMGWAALSGILAGAALVVFARYVAAAFGGGADLVPGLRVASALVALQAVTGAQAGTLAGFEAYRALAVANAAGSGVLFVCVVGGARAWGLEGALWGLVAGQAALWAAQRQALRPAIRRSGIPPAGWREAWHERRVLWQFSLPALMGSALVGPVQWLCSAIMVRQTGGYTEMGLFNAANQIYIAALFLPGVLTAPLLPILSEQQADAEGRQRAMRLIRQIIRLCAWVMLPPVVLASAASPWIMGLYGPEFRGGWLTLCVVLLTAGIFAVEQPVGQAIVATGRLWLALFMNAGWAVVFVLMTVVLGPRGAGGLATARLIAHAVHGLWVFAYVFLAGTRATGDRSAEPRSAMPA